MREHNYPPETYNRSCQKHAVTLALILRIG